jgi:hypothetical protein
MKGEQRIMNQLTNSKNQEVITESEIITIFSKAISTYLQEALEKASPEVHYWTSETGVVAHLKATLQSPSPGEPIPDPPVKISFEIDEKLNREATDFFAIHNAHHPEKEAQEAYEAL